MHIDILWTVIGLVLMIAGLVGCFLPIIPGPPMAYLGLLIIQLFDPNPFSDRFMWTWAIITVVVTVLDYVIPPYGTKRFGGTKYGVWGSTIGLIVGLFVGPLGIVLGPLIGAFLGEMLGGRTARDSVKPAIGSFIGFLAGTLLKLIVSVWMLVHWVMAIWERFV